MRETLYNRLRIMCVVALALGLWSLALAVPAPAIAQQSADIYALADLRTDPGGEGPPTTPGGTATFEHTADGGTRVTVLVMGLTPNSKHANHVHDGSCTGSILHPLVTLEADAQGTARAVTDLKGEVEFGRWWVNVHEGDTLPSPGLICGKVNVAMGGGAPPPSGGAEPTPAQPPTTEPPVSPPGGGAVPGMPATGSDGGQLLAVVLVLAGTMLLSGMGLRLRRTAR